MYEWVDLNWMITLGVLQHAASQGLDLILEKKKALVRVFKLTLCLTRNFAYAW